MGNGSRALILATLTLTAATLAGCPMQYTPGTLTAHDDGRRVGCIELRARSTSDLPARWDAHPEEQQDVLVQLDLGSTCGLPTTVDLRQLHVWIADTSPPRVLSLVDPRHEVRALAIDAETSGSEVLAFRDGRRLPARSTVCVSMSSAVPSAPPGSMPPVCFAYLGRNP